MTRQVAKPERQRRARTVIKRKHRQRLLYRRDEVAAMFGLSMSTIARLESTGQLPGRKLGPSKNNLTLYRAVDVHRLAGVEFA